VRARVVLLGLLLVTGFSAGQLRSSELAALIRAQTESALPQAHSSTASTSTPAAEERSALRSLYAAGKYTPLWLDAAGRPGPDVRVAIQLLTSAGEDGLEPGDYDSIRLERVARDLAARPSTPARELARFDVDVSAAMLRYLRHLHAGRVDPRRLGFRVTVPFDAHDFPAALRAAVTDHRITELAAELRPATEQYQRLRVMLVRYRVLAADGSLGIAAPTATLRPGDVYGDAARLTRLLAAFGDLPHDGHATSGLVAEGTATGPPTTESRYEGPLVDGVRAFQRRHGLDADGVIGPRTVAALRVPLSWRVRQIDLALERQRWLPHPSDGRQILINIPMFRLWVWEPNSLAPSMSMGVIVGRALRTETPIFVQNMRDVIFRPYWNIPRSILRDELLPLILSDPEYLARQNMEIVDGPGDDAPLVEPTVDHLDQLGQGRFRLRQRPGPQNALGLVKFVFPNEEHVYLHDTPAPGLFARSRRDFSHGCVRVEGALDLAAWALADHPDWTRERIEEAVAEDAPTRSVRLAQPIRVVLFYATAALSPDDGTLHFADDIYRHDEPLDRAVRALR
jgi:L,D-transpeptidase YcbB